MKLLSGSSCQFKGKVINLGLPKSGTTSLSRVLTRFGYKSNFGTHAAHKAQMWLAADTSMVYVRHLYHLLHTLFFFYGYKDNHTGNCSDINRFYRLDYLNRVEYVSHRSFNFGDTPKPYFYPLYTTWYPKQFKKVKYILTIRQDTNTIVNSRLRFDLLRKLTYKKNHRTEYIFKTFIQMVGNWNWELDFNLTKNDNYDYHQKLAEFRDFLVSKSDLPTISDLNVVAEYIESSTSARDVDLWVYFVDNYYFSDWNVVNQVVPCNPCNKENDLKIQDFAHFLGMRYELHKQGVVDWFHNLQYKFGGDINDDLLILRLKDSNSYQQLSSFLGCEVDYDQAMDKINAAAKIRYRIIPRNDILDWRSYFNGCIPILTIDKQNNLHRLEMIDDGPFGYDHLY